MFKVLWAIALSSVVMVSQASGSDFGVCEKTVLRRMLNTTINPPEYYKFNVTIRECCEGFMAIGAKLNCIPMCANVCVNAHCIGNNNCQCHPGYYAVDRFRCLPKCDPACGPNMACLAPNRCLCKPDYKKTNESHCEPTCSFTADNFECINAKCVSPNKCDCFEGFRRVSEFQCEPICTNCVNGECIAPDVCECYEGFEKNSEGICEPVCEPMCINAKCIEPDTCECYESFEKYLKSHECLEKQIIKDHQTCLKSCQHGTCGDDGTCVCDSGYESYNGKCLKVCSAHCANGRCLEYQCVCPESYKLSENGTSCHPICAFEDEHDCIFGSCVAPQTCECFEGYRFLDERNCTCVPMCSPMCVNGICTEHGCICHENFYNISEYECVKNCSEGFKWMYDECMEESSFDMFETVDTRTTESTTSTEETTEETGVPEYDEDDDDDEIEDEKDEDEDDSLETSSDVQTTERDEKVMTKSISPQLIPVKTCIVIISIISVLIILILLSYCVLYKRVNQKNIYYVNEQVSNCVYFSKQSEPAALPEVETNL